LVFAIPATECGVAQEPQQIEPPQTTNDALHAMSRLAGAIFTGQVIAVRRLDGANGATGVVEIEFAVEDAVRGVSGSSYTLREWAGLWPAGDEPFRVGQRYLMLLHAPSAAGLSSPVGGMDGTFPVHGSMQTQATVSAEAASAGTASAETVATRTVAAKTGSAALSALADGRVVDLRWVATRVVQPLSYRATPVAHPTALPFSMYEDTVGAESASSSQTANVGVSDAGASVTSIDATPASGSQDTAYTTVLGMLRSWENSDHATR
jgi:hypothetical protein